MSEIAIRKLGRVGRITLNRTKALNAVTLQMIHAIGDALPGFAEDDDISMLVIDSEGDKAFCATPHGLWIPTSRTPPSAAPWPRRL